MTNDEAVSAALRIERSRRNWTADPIARPAGNGQPENYGVAIRTSSGRRIEAWTLDDLDAIFYRA